uniref:Lipocalin/cytosolic fatty-acid binding domain-containing protein n=1 Tax=Leersia perrieri TaxID=77586 RepID=A0A0D9W9U1_9ORYZ
MVVALLLLGSSPSYSLAATHPASACSSGSRRKCSPVGRNNFRCSLDDKVLLNTHGVSTKLLSCFAASLVFISPPCQAIPAETFVQPNLCPIADIAAIDKAAVPLKFDSPSDDGGTQLMMRGMTANNFDPIRYSGRWFEVASLKRGFAGQGQEDCHCTQGVYSFDEKSRSIQVDTFCVHGGPDGYITGIRGRVQCLSEADMANAETDLERQEMIKGKCFLRFPTLPFIPKEPYDVLATDYDNYAIVSGAKDTSFIQIYSRTPNPGPEFIEKYKSYSANFGYDPSKIKDTPQDCEVMSTDQLDLMMSMPGMTEALTNQFPDLKLNAPVAFNPFTSVFDTLKKLVELYFK